MKFLKNRILGEISALKNDTMAVEYIAWWLLRICMIVTAVVFTVKGEAIYARNLILLNTLATFAIPILRFISPTAIFTSRVSYRIQTYIDIFIFMGSFLGHGFSFLGKVPEYDKFMHLLAGGIVVFIGAEIVKAFRGYAKTSPGIISFCSTGFSFMIIVAWEMMEFFADWFITDSNNQGYHIVPDKTMILVKIFGMPKNAYNNPLYDTNADMFFAVVGCVICTVILAVYLSKKQKKSASAVKDTVKAV